MVIFTHPYHAYFCAIPHEQLASNLSDNFKNSKYSLIQSVFLISIYLINF